MLISDARSEGRSGRCGDRRHQVDKRHAEDIIELEDGTCIWA